MLNFNLEYDQPKSATVHKKSSGSRFVIGAITLLYVCYAFYVILFWYLVQSDFTDHSDTREILFDSISGGDGPFWPMFITGIITFVMAAVGDAILVSTYLHRNFWFCDLFIILRYGAAILFGAVPCA